MATKSDVTEDFIKKLSELLQWVALQNDTLKRQRPVGGDIESVRQQLEIVQVRWIIQIVDSLSYRCSLYKLLFVDYESLQGFSYPLNNYDCSK